MADLFWAINGGGGGSLGVVLAYKINFVEVPKTSPFSESPGRWRRTRLRSFTGGKK
ncbi:unnamed protein product [Brassica oleracea]|uniref:Uncharacterized protein n=2 Tax=Brassica TaxID=3705 RepID=A0A3P6G0M5_BRAOL|nr:unnamed protein product [Brassica napus]VDD54056.1 unnamed protein product [Brassica oleracea]